MFDIMFDNSAPPSCWHTKWWTNELRLLFKYFYAGIVQSNLCWKIHNKYVFHVNIHIFVLKYLVQIQIIQNQFKISEGGKWNSHQMPCVKFECKGPAHSNIKAQPMCKFAQLYACHELFLKWRTVRAVLSAI